MWTAPFSFFRSKVVTPFSLSHLILFAEGAALSKKSPFFFSFTFAFDFFPADSRAVFPSFLLLLASGSVLGCSLLLFFPGTFFFFSQSRGAFGLAPLPSPKIFSPAFFFPKLFFPLARSASPGASFPPLRIILIHAWCLFLATSFPTVSRRQFFSPLARREFLFPLFLPFFVAEMLTGRFFRHLLRFPARTLFFLPFFFPFLPPRARRSVRDPFFSPFQYEGAGIIFFLFSGPFSPVRFS